MLGNHAVGRVHRACGLGQIMSGVIIAMRRTLLSCTSLVRNGLIGLAAVALPTSEPASAAEPSLLGAISTLLDFNRSEIAVLATVLAPLGFSVVAAILLMRSRVRAARSEARLRADFCVHDLRLKEMLLGIADDYLWLAAYVEARRKSRPWLPTARKVAEKADAALR